MKKPKVLTNVRQAMEEKQINLTVLSFQSGIELARLSRMVNGWLIPNEKDKERISSVLGVSKRQLFPGN